METLLGLFLLGAFGFYLYLRSKEEKEDKSSLSEPFRKLNTSKINTNKQIDSSKVNSTSDNVKYLKTELRKLRKEAERMERHDQDGLDDVKSEIKHIEKIIHPYEVDQLLKKVTDLKSYRALEKKYENTDYGETISYEEIERREAVLEEAFTIAGEKTYKYILWADVSIDTPLAVLEKAGKAYFPDEASKIKESCDQCILSEVPFSEAGDINSEIEDYKIDLKDAGIKELIKLRAVFENDSFDEIAKDKKINEIVSKSNILKELYFDDYGNDDYYDQYLFKRKVQKLSEYNIPKVEKFIASGYETIDEIVNVDANEISSWDGVGKITLDKIVEAQERVKKDNSYK